MWRELFIVLAGAVGGAGAAVLLQQWSKRRKAAADTLFKIYMLLMEVNGQHFWITSREVRSEEPRQETLKRFEDLRWQIADEARKVDYVPEIRDVLHALFSLSFESEAKRNARLSELLDRMGKKLNPKYAQIMKEITNENGALMVSDVEEFIRRQRKIQPLF